MSSGGNRVIGPGHAVDAEAGDSAILTHQTGAPKKRMVSLVTFRPKIPRCNSVGLDFFKGVFYKGFRSTSAGIAIPHTAYITYR